MKFFRLIHSRPEHENKCSILMSPCSAHVCAMSNTVFDSAPVARAESQQKATRTEPEVRPALNAVKA